MARKMTKEEIEYQKSHPDAIFCLDESLTKQEFKEECDANEILRRASNGQDLSSILNSRVAQYGDFTNIPDFRESMNFVARANGMFMELDWKLRERFHNDPAKMLEFLQDPENRDEALKLGLIAKKEEPVVPEPTRVVIVNEAKGGTPAAAGSAATGPEPK